MLVHLIVNWANGPIDCGFFMVSKTTKRLYAIKREVGENDVFRECTRDWNGMDVSGRPGWHGIVHEPYLVFPVAI
jgi:hypothetical protein